jgi:uncharacterized protein YndB with AHSA1/START domain
MPTLFPTFPAPPAVVQNTGVGGVRYGRSWEFDFAKGDFKVDGTGRVHGVDGHSAWVQWCVKTVLTPRRAYLAFTAGYGCEVEDAMRLAASRREVESEVTRTVTEALLGDSRTRAVSNFAFTWNGDEIHVSFTAEPIIGTAERLEVELNG